MNRYCRGSAMIYALIVVMILSVMITIMLNISNYERMVSKSYRDYSDLYDMAVSGAENALALFNEALEENTPAILDLTITALNTYDFTSLAEYVNMDANVYGGDFCLTGQYFAKEFIKNANQLLADKIYTDGAMSFEFSIEVSGSATSDKYKTTVEALPDDKGNFIITSTAFKERLSASATVKADVSIGGTTVGNEIIIPQFSWKAPPAWVNNTLNPAMAESYIYEAALPSTYQWTPQNPLMIIPSEVISGAGIAAADIISGAGIGVVDVSAFYDGGIPIPSIIISGGSGLRITASDPLKNTLKAVVFSKGGINIEGVGIYGSIISSIDILVGDGAYTLPSSDMLFEPIFADEEIRRRVYDYFRATSFHIGGDIGAAKISGASAYVIERIDDIRYYITGLASVY